MEQDTATYTANSEPSAQPWRKAVQFAFLALNGWIGFLFLRFVAQVESGIAPTVARPPGVEGYLPIGSLVSLKHWLVTGTANTIHPAGLVLLIVFIVIAILLKKGFCSWFCPVGLFSEYLEKLRKLFIKRPVVIPAWVDYPMRGIKYLLTLFFVWAIVFQMDGAQAEGFILGDYNKIADIKMLRFFTEITPFALTVLVILVVMSVVVPYFWCRFLCPYGALLGVLSIFSPVSVKRDKETCIDCKACTVACPALISVHKVAQVSSDECHACYKCVDACPVQDTLAIKMTGVNKRISGWLYAALIVSMFVVATGAAQLFGYWETSITSEEYMQLAPQVSDLSHETGL